MKLDMDRILTIKAYFETRPVLKAYLLGSYVRNEADALSDTDILVDLWITPDLSDYNSSK